MSGVDLYTTKPKPSPLVQIIGPPTLTTPSKELEHPWRYALNRFLLIVKITKNS
jgi:hypothetical protein